MSRGIVVRHKENGMQYAISSDNFNPQVHRKVRDLTVKESVRSYRPRQAPAEPKPVRASEKKTPFSMRSTTSHSKPVYRNSVDSPTEAPVAGAADTKNKEG